MFCVDTCHQRQQMYLSQWVILHHVQLRCSSCCVHQVAPNDQPACDALWASDHEEVSITFSALLPLSVQSSDQWSSQSDKLTGFCFHITRVFTFIYVTVRFIIVFFSTRTSEETREKPRTCSCLDQHLVSACVSRLPRELISGLRGTMSFLLWVINVLLMLILSSCLTLSSFNRQPWYTTSWLSCWKASDTLP